MDTQNIKVIVFDIDGTLAETDDFYVEKSAVLLHKIMPFVTIEKLQKTVRPTIMMGETLLHSFYGLLDKVRMDGIISKLHAKLSVKKEYQYREVAGMKETVAELSRSYKIGIITSGSRKSTDAFLKKFDLENYVLYVIAAEDCKFIKPNPEPMLKMAEKAGVLPENCLMVGDTVFDILCARRSGACVAAVKSGFDTPAFLSKYLPDYLLNSVNDLPEILIKK